jgi:iron complex outermembrane recepter protein
MQIQHSLRVAEKIALTGFVVATASMAMAENQASTSAGQPTLMPEVVVADQSESAFRANKTSSATGFDMPAELVPQTVNVLTRELLDATNVDSLDAATMWDTSVGSGGSSLYSRTSGQYTIRGYAASDVLVQGMPLPTGMGTVLDTAMIDQIDVVKGPIGSLEGGQTSTLGPYGAGGSIILKMKQPLMENSTSLTAYARLTEGGGQKYRAIVDDNRVNKEGTFGARTVVSAEYDHPFWLKGADGGQRYTIAPSFTWKPDARSKYVLNASFQYQDIPAYQGVPVLGGHFVSPYSAWFGGSEARNEYKGVLLQGHAEWKAGHHWTIRSGAGMGYSDVDYNMWAVASTAPNKKMASLDYYNSIVETGTANYEYAWADVKYLTWNWYTQGLAKYKTGEVDHEFLVGLDYTGRSQRGNSSFKTTDQRFSISNPEVPISMGRIYTAATETERTLQRAGFTLQELAKWNNWNLLVGGKVDTHFSDEGNSASSFSPRVGLSRSLGDHVVLFGNFARTSAPNFGYEGVDGKELTDSWTANQYEGGVRVNPVGNLWLSASWFMIEQSNTPETSTSDPTKYETYGKSRSKGCEVTLSGNITKAWSSYLSYTFQKYKDIDSGISFDRNPPHAVALWQQYEIQGGALSGTKLGLGYRFRDKSYATLRGNKIAENYTLPSYNVFDCAVEFPLPTTAWLNEASLRLALYNIFNEKYVASARHAVQCFTGDPRTFEICLKTKF